MLAPKNRLKNKKDFERIFKSGKSFKEDFLFLKACRNNLKDSRFGVVVSKKYSKSAVVRNKARRKIKESLRLKMPNIKDGFDVAIMARPGLGVEDFWDLDKKMDLLLKKAGLFK